MKLRKLLSVSVAALAVSAFAVSAAAENAYIGFQTTVYSYRNNHADASYGIATDYFDKFIVWGNNDPETFPDYEDNFDYDIEGYVLPATYTDAVITGDGTYTVKAEGLDWALDGSSDFNLIFVSTDIPADSGAVCTEATIIVDGVEVKTVANPISDETDPGKNLQISLANTWNAEIGGYGLAFPKESLEVRFTIEGLGAPAAEAPAEEAPAEEAPADDAAAPETGDVDAATDSEKGSPDTGIEDVAVIGGLAILAGAAIAITRKRK